MVDLEPKDMQYKHERRRLLAELHDANSNISAWEKLAADIDGQLTDLDARMGRSTGSFLEGAEPWK